LGNDKSQPKDIPTSPQPLAVVPLPLEPPRIAFQMILGWQA
jgi:hypothetical protein